MQENNQDRLMELLVRADALGDACVAVGDWCANPRVAARTLEVLLSMRDEAVETFNRYRCELGLVDEVGS